MMPAQPTIVIAIFIVETKNTLGEKIPLQFKTRGQLLPYTESFLNVYVCLTTLKIIIA